MTFKFFIATAAILSFTAYAAPQTSYAATTFSTQNATSASTTASALSASPKGTPVRLTDGTQIGVLKSGKINNFGDAQLLINTKGYTSVVRLSRTLVLTASARRVNVSDGSITIDVIRERLINNVSRDAGSGNFVRATILN